MFSKKCKAHLEDVGETGLEHAKGAVKAAIKLQGLVPILLIHAIAPRLFINTATKTMQDILKDRQNGK
jgi:hypothetical protein